MGKVYEAIDARLERFIAAQRMFFVATAPLAAGGHVNLSPKGLDCFRVLGPRRVAYLDLTGSGVETIAHLRENGRIVVMFCAFEGAPKILRLHGRGAVIEPGDAEFAALAARFPAQRGVRAVIAIDVERISDSCGYAVPLYRFLEPRETLTHWAERQGDAGLARYREQNNARSIDGLAGLRGRVGDPESR